MRCCGVFTRLLAHLLTSSGRHTYFTLVSLSHSPTPAKGATTATSPIFAMSFVLAVVHLVFAVTF